MGKTKQWNVPQSLAIAKAFYFLNHAGKACLLPFLPLYFRLLGLSATQVGIICGTRAFISLWATPVWAKMAKKYNVRRLVILFALFMTIACTLSLTVIPPIDEDYTSKFCPGNHTDGAEETGKVNGLIHGSLQGGIGGNTSADVFNTEEPFQQPVENMNSGNDLPTEETHVNSTEIAQQSSSGVSQQTISNAPFLQENLPLDNLPEELGPQDTSSRKVSVKNELIDDSMPRAETGGIMNTGSFPEELGTPDDEEKEELLPSEPFFIPKDDSVIDSTKNAANLFDHRSPMKGNTGLSQSTLPETRLPTEKRSRYDEFHQQNENLETRKDIDKPNKNYYTDFSESNDYPQYVNNNSPVDEETPQEGKEDVSNLLNYLLTKYQDAQPEVRERLLKLSEKFGEKQPDAEGSDKYNEGYEDFENSPYYNEQYGDSYHESPVRGMVHKKSTYHKSVSNREKRATSLMEGLKSIVHELKVEILPLQYRTFLIVLTVIIIGELLTSQVEKICDDSLYEFLDNLDDIEKYGQQKYWSSLGIAICATGVAALVDNTDCFLNQGINHFMIHFYTFAGVVGLAFLLALFYPIHPVCKEHNQRKISKSFRLLLTDCRNICYLVTVFVAGCLAASIHNFLFWLVQDKGGSEIIMGLSVTVSTCAEIPMMFLGNWLIKRVTHAGLVSIAFLGLSVRFLYYSFLWTPWAVVPIELLHSFSYGAFWGAIMGYAEHISPPGIERTVQAIIAAIYWGLGFGTGSMVSGVIYDKYGVTILYRAACVVSVVWCLGFVLFQRFAPRKAKMNYSRLLRQTKSNIRVDNTVSSDDEDKEDDDWLEKALRETERRCEVPLMRQWCP
ncbi:PREDICTED: LOW QUALITY PROTEIN: major facilitator superfamily domain-containing protein 6-like protein B [Branchiostoma belcheri]|uniref:LOW QUALITY PROTEIN: major facilitator superfamily domain-containing protein 6-like protein B n=1 Tax=Branchiostoma belcheri TaxID=7741 RepID=A0A6P4ZRD9_BRABE|nr:PREDICTED: LOW QUALITY PROTEIN: major facilitator superfamily domain-containing protein 6-like protein B [Branchiostoma belcheri]